MTRYLAVDSATCRVADLAPAVDWLRNGGVLAFPTDTFYGLAADPASRVAVELLFELKGRASSQAIPIIAASVATVRDYCGPLNSATERLAAHFWPGPLSLVVVAPASVVPTVHAGTGTIAVRVPAHRLARELADACGTPITATSGNRSGRPPATTVLELGDLTEDERVFVIDGGAAPGGKPSTIVDARADQPRLIREGAVAWEAVVAALRL